MDEPWCNHDAAAVHDGVCECGSVLGQRKVWVLSATAGHEGHYSNEKNGRIDTWSADSAGEPQRWPAPCPTCVGMINDIRAVRPDR